jgi:putative ABC transport system permease protein
MRMAARELIRRPRGFLVPVAILALLALLLLYPSSILDGLVMESTAGLRNAPTDLVVYSQVANGVIARSRIEKDVRQKVAAVPGVAQAATYDVLAFSGTMEGRAEPVGLALTASSESLGVKEPGPGEAIADSNMKTRLGAKEGTKVLVGPFNLPVTIVGFANGSNLFFANGFVVSKATWLKAFANVDFTPEQVDAIGSQVLFVTLQDGASPTEVAAAIDEATAGATMTMTRDLAIHNLPGIAQQEQVFGYMRFITLAVALVVVALFLSFMTLERAPLYAALKAIGAASRQLFGALVFQVLLVTVLAVTAAALITFALTRAPSAIPTIMLPQRVVETTIALAVTAVLGSGLSLRRVINVDPADAIG